MYLQLQPIVRTGTYEIQTRLDDQGGMQSIHHHTTKMWNLLKNEEGTLKFEARDDGVTVATDQNSRYDDLVQTLHPNNIVNTGLMSNRALSAAC